MLQTGKSWEGFECKGQIWKRKTKFKVVAGVLWIWSNLVMNDIFAEKDCVTLSSAFDQVGYSCRLRATGQGLRLEEEEKR